MSNAINFTYDSKDRLTQETSTRFGNYTENNEWDDAGNATTYRDVERAFNDDNQIDVYGFEYDGNGNPTTYSGVSASYNANNQLTSYGSHFEAGYRADGLRAYKHWEDTETEDPPAEWTYYLFMMAGMRWLSSMRVET